MGLHPALRLEGERGAADDLVLDARVGIQRLAIRAGARERGAHDVEAGRVVVHPLDPLAVGAIHE